MSDQVIAFCNYKLLNLGHFLAKWSCIWQRNTLQ